MAKYHQWTAAGKGKVNSSKTIQNTELVLRARAINLKTIPYKFNQSDFALQQKNVHMYTTYRLALYFPDCPLSSSN